MKMKECNTDRLDRIEEAEPGTLVAFRHKDGSVKSAKIVRKSVSEKVLKLETAYGKSFVVKFEDVMWVKTGNLWPKSVYLMLKGKFPESGVGHEEGKKQEHRSDSETVL
jgi:hypothetical protein